jgi:hypothetical protein
LADPVVSLALYAETRGFYSFKDYSGDERTKLACRWCMFEARKALSIELAKADALRLYAEMSIPNIDAEGARLKAQDAFRRIRQYLKPWIFDRSAVVAEDPLDSIALWYIINAPEILERLGVDLGPDEPSSEG